MLLAARRRFQPKRAKTTASELNLTHQPPLQPPASVSAAPRSSLTDCV